ncbi:MAG: LamG domain-containing protein [Planctomycetota bacterium]|jgi:hypothetical protein
MRERICIGLVLLVALSSELCFAAKDGLVAWWKFDEGKGNVTIDSISGKEDTILRNFKYVPGVSGTGVKFDGFTTHIRRKAVDAPRLSGSFSVEAWVGPQAYPWDRCAIVNQEEKHRAGYYFGIDDTGRIGLHLAINGKWRECTTEARIPFMKWSHIAGTFEKDKGILVYINGKKAGELRANGQMTPANDVDLLIGRDYEKRFTNDRAQMHYSFDGILDELKIYNRALTPEQVRRSFEASKPKGEFPLQWRKLPQIPPSPKQFGAHYCKLRFYEEWDAVWRVGDHPDVVVGFDEGPYKMVFWHGTSYNNNLVTENGRWLAHQSAETGSDATVGCCEHMSDKHCRYSHVRVIEDHDARVVVHWRYALNDILYQIVYEASEGWGVWADQYYYIYPDGAAALHIIVHGMDEPPSLLSPQLLNQPGERAEDNISLDAITVANMAGQTKTYNWEKWPSSGRVRSRFFDELPNQNICVFNLKSKYKPFHIYEPGTLIIPYGGGGPPGNKISKFHIWNHWPVAQIPSDGRGVRALDRVSSSEITSPEPPMKRREDGSFEASLIQGLSNKPIDKLAPLAKSWLDPAEMVVKGKAFRSDGYSRSERAYIVSNVSGKANAFAFELNADESSPVVNPVFVVKNWGDGGAKIRIDGRTIRRGKSFRFGHRHGLDGSDLIVWLKVEAVKPIKVKLLPAT